MQTIAVNNLNIFIASLTDKLSVKIYGLLVGFARALRK